MRRRAADASAWVVASPHTSAGSRRLLGALEVIAVPDGTGGFVHNGDIHVIDGLGRVHGIYDDARWRDAMRDASLLAAQAS